MSSCFDRSTRVRVQRDALDKKFEGFPVDGSGHLRRHEGEAPQDAAQGEALYSFYCATCHGNDATGNGPMSPSLVVQPVDLTQLSAGNGGIFPVTRVVMRVDGRDALVSHGSAMPVYGDFFAGNDVATKAEDGQPIGVLEEQ